MMSLCFKLSGFATILSMPTPKVATPAEHLKAQGNAFHVAGMTSHVWVIALAPL